MEMVNVKALPGSIPTPNSGSIMEKKIRKNLGSQMGQTDKKHKKKTFLTAVCCNITFKIFLTTGTKLTESDKLLN